MPKLSSVSWIAMVGGYLRVGRSVHAIDMFRRTREFKFVDHGRVLERSIETLEVSLHELDIIIAQNEKDEPDKEIEVISERQEEPQKESKEDQPLVLWRGGGMGVWGGGMWEGGFGGGGGVWGLGWDMWFLSDVPHLENPVLGVSDDTERPDLGLEREVIDDETQLAVSLESEGFAAADVIENPSFSSVEEEPVVVDEEKLEGVLSVLQSSFDGDLFSRLDAMELSLSEEFVDRVIRTPLIPGVHLIEFFKWVSQCPEFSVTTRIVDSLVRAVSAGRRRTEAYALWDLVRSIGEKEIGLLNTETLNELITLFWKLGKGKAALEVFDKFEEYGCEPNADSYYLTVEALCRRKIFDWAWPVCEKMLNAGKLPDGEKIGNIITSFCKGSKAKDAHLVYLMAKEKNILPPQSSINFLIASLCKKDETVKLAVELLEVFSGDARKHAVKPFATVVGGLCRVKDIQGAKKLLFEMIDAGPPPGNAVFNSIITGVSKAGEMEEAMSLLKVMESRGLRPDVYAYSVIMSGYVKSGQMEEARKILLEAQKKHAKLTPVTFHILIRGYCKNEEYDKALQLLKVMKKSGVQPNADEYNKMIQSLCLKALDWGKAEKLLEEMKRKGLHLNGITRSLIKAVKELEDEELQTNGVLVGA
ncbi:hypothetical protein Sjap_002682 [Stephania japonica]|uniref:Pentatricopeptide repeat-containing protein n=1 Tax=Stephania japonica TaxID=461633 RepID=A0AAP0KMB2_9MAGN